MLQDIIHQFKALQTEICNGLEALDEKATFKHDLWLREEGGGGDTRVIADGQVFEKGGVNFSHVYGLIPEVLKGETQKASYFHATGVSIVIHPINPYVPIIHMNVRYFEMSDVEGGPIVDAWFGGGIDLSPAYPNEADTQYLHQQLKAVCDQFNDAFYAKFKKWCDDYFTITHRKEMRGVGGIFFDHLRPGNDLDLSQLFDFVLSVGKAFLPIYSDIVLNNMDRHYGKQQQQWQYIRRGRYAEFNLVYDRGTSFGLRTNGRTESILMSLPPRAEWVYDYHPELGSEEADTLLFFQPTNWV